MKKLLTISIAAYNVEKYIEQTLESFVCNNKNIMNLFEVIIVNDGSNDKTLNIAKRYHKMYPNTFKIIDKENGGYGSTINASLSIAEGKYFKLVDGDDWVNKKGFEEFLKKLEKIESDMVVSKYCLVEDETLKKTIVDGNFTYNNQTMKFEELDEIEALPMHYLAIKTKILKENNIKITERCYYTDVEYILKPIPYIDTITFIDECVYMYRIGRNGQSVSIASWQKNIDMAIKVTFILIEFYNQIDKSNISEYKKNYIFRRVLATVIGKYRIFISFPPSKDIKKKLMEYDKKILDCNIRLYNNSINNIYVRLLRKSKFVLYRPLSIAYRIYLKFTKQI